MSNVAQKISRRGRRRHRRLCRRGRRRRKALGSQGCVPLWPGSCHRFLGGTTDSSRRVRNGEANQFSDSRDSAGAGGRNAGVAVPARADDTIKIGVLHAPKGTMAISEATLKGTVLTRGDDLNMHGGFLDK